MTSLVQIISLITGLAQFSKGTSHETGDIQWGRRRFLCLETAFMQLFFMKTIFKFVKEVTKFDNGYYGVYALF
jgi:hypothetical protein